MRFTHLSIMGTLLLFLLIVCGSSYAQAPDIVSDTSGRNAKGSAIYSAESIMSDFVLFAENGATVIKEANNDLGGSREDSCCCDVSGDADNNGAVNLLDITCIINYCYKGGPYFDCPAEADASGNCAINILDVTRPISYLYTAGPQPVYAGPGCDLCYP